MIQLIQFLISFHTDLSGLSIQSPSTNRMIKDEYSAGGSSGMEMMDSPGGHGGVMSPGSSIGHSDSGQHQSLPGSGTPSSSAGSSTHPSSAPDMTPGRSESNSGSATGSQTVQHHPPSNTSTAPTGVSLFSGHNVTITPVQPSSHPQAVAPSLIRSGPTSPPARASSSTAPPPLQQPQSAPPPTGNFPPGNSMYYSNAAAGEQSGKESQSEENGSADDYKRGQVHWNLKLSFTFFSFLPFSTKSQTPF